MQFSETNLTFPTDTRLSAILIAYKDDASAFIADRVMPRATLPGQSKAVKYTVFDNAGTFTVPDTRVGRKGEPDEVDFGGDEKSAVCKDYGLQAKIPNEDIQLARTNPAYNPEAVAVEGIAGLLMLDREVRVANMAKDADNYEAANVQTLSGNTQFSHASSDPATTLWTRIDAMRVRPNFMAMGQAVWNKLRHNAKFIQEVRHNKEAAGALNRREVADHFELDLAIGAAHVNTNRPGKTLALGRAWSKIVHLSYKQSAASGANTMSWARTFTYGGKVAGRLIDQRVGLRGGVVVKAGESLAEVVIAKWAGALIKDAVA